MQLCQHFINAAFCSVNNSITTLKFENRQTEGEINYLPVGCVHEFPDENIGDKMTETGVENGNLAENNENWHLNKNAVLYFIRKNPTWLERLKYCSF